MSADDKTKSTMVHSFQECMAKGGRIVECHPNAYATNHYAVRIRMPNDFEKFFPNVIEEHVKPFLDGDNFPSAQSGNAAKQNQELSSEGENESSEKAGSRTNFLNAMHNGGVIIEYHKNKRGNYTVRVKLPSNDTEVFPNITEEHFNQFKTKIAQEKPPEPEHHHRDTFEKTMNEGGCIEGVIKFESYSIYVKMPEGNIEQFGNISSEHLEKYKDRIVLHPELVHDRNIDHQHRKGDTFEVCMQKPGVTIIDYHAHPFYSLHVKTSNGKVEYYSHISEKRLEKYQHSKPED